MVRKRNPDQAQFEGAEEQVETTAFRAPDLWVESQAKAFEQIDEVARRWLDRRREALDATRQSFEEMRSSDNIGELMRIQQEWMVGQMRRLVADFVEFSGIALNLAQRATSQAGRTAEGAAHDMERAGHELGNAATGGRHAAD
ncbi:MAG TPA: phasin family protein [Stellaceae bacterium]|nr:phasin family protein [Stellaceae bacterium]